MKIQAELLVKQFLRSYTETFSIEEFAAFIKECGVKSTIKDCEEYLAECDNVFLLKSGFYATRAAAFTNQYFSFKPGRKEIEQGMFITGHRCMPFVDPDVLSFGICFYYKDELLIKKIGTFDSKTVLDCFYLYGDEYSSQYVASDPANADVDLGKSDFVLPQTVKITGNNIKPLLEDGFKYGDRIICRVVDWDRNCVEIDFESRNSSGLQMTMEDVARSSWYSELEKDLVSSFDILGPLSSIEEQLCMIFANNRDRLCKKNCGSLDEFFERTNKVGFELFGVETRLWHKGQDVPAVGKWNQIQSDSSIDESYNDSEENDEIEQFEPVSPVVIDSFVKDALFNKNEDISEILKKIYPNFYKMGNFQLNIMLLNLKNRHGIISSSYNRFADSEFGEIRHKALELFSQVNSLVYSIDMIKSDLKNYPQQALVILSQIYAHIMQIIEAIETDVSAVLREKAEISLSLEGMELNFECVSEDLKAVLEKEKKNGFSVIK